MTPRSAMGAGVMAPGELFDARDATGSLRRFRIVVDISRATSGRNDIRTDSAVTLPSVERRSEAMDARQIVMLRIQ